MPEIDPSTLRLADIRKDQHVPFPSRPFSFLLILRLKSLFGPIAFEVAFSKHR